MFFVSVEKRCAFDDATRESFDFVFVFDKISEGDADVGAYGNCRDIVYALVTLKKSAQCGYAYVAVGTKLLFCDFVCFEILFDKISFVFGHPLLPIKANLFHAVYHPIYWMSIKFDKFRIIILIWKESLHKD